VIHDLSFKVPSGRITGLLGPSGCGKSTLMRAIVGVQITEAGSVEVLGESAGSVALRRQVGYVTQAPSVYGDLTVRENLDFFARVLGAPRSRVDEVIETVSLTSNVVQPAGSLSGGQRSRVSLATALLGDPDLLVLDEPTVGLDIRSRADILSHVRELIAEEGIGVLWATHLIDEVGEDDQVVVLHQGRVLADGVAARVVADSGAASIREAFTLLTSSGEAASEAA
jgi:ABC-2 type transport system ATP-binding protein